MEIENYERLVVVTAVDGQRYMAWVPQDKGNPKEYMSSQRQQNLPVELSDARTYLSQIQPNVEGGLVRGLATLQVLMPIDMFPAALPVLNVYASSWYFPSDNPGCKNQVASLLADARKNEQMNKAIAAGIVPAGTTGGLPPPPGGASRH